MAGNPELSIIVIGYKMPEQLLNTLYTLSADYQRGIDAASYEVIVVENASSDNIDPDAIAALNGNFRFFRRDETGQSPVPAINFAFTQCRGRMIGLMIDGARMLSPGILSTCLELWRQSEAVLVAIPGYHIGDQEQHKNEDPTLARQREQELLAAVNWRENGYQLFTVSTFSGANRRGYLQPIMECNCLFTAAEHYKAIGYADPRFMMPGGGSVNLHMYRSLGLLPGTEFHILAGEGSYHQYHGGVTTSSYGDRQAEIERHRVQLQSFWPDGFHSLRRQAKLSGEVSPQAQPFLERSRQLAEKRRHRLDGLNLPLWPDEPGQVSSD